MYKMCSKIIVFIFVCIAQICRQMQRHAPRANMSIAIYLHISYWESIRSLYVWWTDSEPGLSIDHKRIVLIRLKSKVPWVRYQGFFFDFFFGIYACLPTQIRGSFFRNVWLPRFWLGVQSPPDPPTKRSYLAFDRGGQTGPPRSNDFVFRAAEDTG